MARPQPTVDDYVRGVLERNVAMLGRTITLIESTHPKHRALAHEVLAKLMPYAGQAHRIGVTGVPGVGKSTFIDAFGSMLTAEGYRVAVLAVDPSSRRTGGSILGDKTRMARLAVDDAAFVRPSPSSGTLGGVTRMTRETMIVCEAAGFDVLLVETVGVGQSETVVADMVDFFLVLMLAGAGDELQGIKKGVLELADMIAVNKADGDNVTAAERAAHRYRSALHILTPASPNWQPPVKTVSGMAGSGLGELWTAISEHRATLSGTGEFEARRRAQQLRWMWQLIDDQLRRDFLESEGVQAQLVPIEKAVSEGALVATGAAEALVAAFRDGLRRNG